MCLTDMNNNPKKKIILTVKLCNYIELKKLTNLLASGRSLIVKARES